MEIKGWRKDMFQKGLNVVADREGREYWYFDDGFGVERDISSQVAKEIEAYQFIDKHPKAPAKWRVHVANRKKHF